MTTEERNKALIRRFVEAADTGDTTSLREFVSPDCVATDGRVRVPCGLSGMAEHIRAVRETYPDLRLTVERQVAEGEWVATQVTARGTHLGSWLGMAPTGKTVTLCAVNLDRIVDGRIVEHGGAANTFEALLEIGAIRPVGGFDPGTDPPAGSERPGGRKPSGDEVPG
jgi:predicted ester cyclase